MANANDNGNNVIPPLNPQDNLPPLPVGGQPLDEVDVPEDGGPVAPGAAGILPGGGAGAGAGAGGPPGAGLGAGVLPQQPQAPGNPAGPQPQAQNVPQIRGNFYQNVVESDMVSHMWFEMPRLSGKTPPGCAPSSTSLAEWLSYWEEKRLAYGGDTPRAIEKALRYIAPATKAVWTDATSMARITHERGDWQLFKTTCQKVFQVSKSDVVDHPLRDNNWLIRLPSNNKTTPRNQSLRSFANVSVKPLKQFSEILFNPARHVSGPTIRKTYHWLQAMRLFPDGHPNCPRAITAYHRAFILLGAAWAMRLQAISAFKFFILPAQLFDQFSDVLEETIPLTPNNENCIMEDLIEELASFLTTQHAISGPSLAEKMRNLANQAAAVNTQPTNPTNETPSGDVAALRGGRGRGRGRGGRGGRGGRRPDNDDRNADKDGKVSEVDSTQKNDETKPKDDHVSWFKK